MYSQLDATQKEIRLLTLEPGAESDGFRCRLNTYSLDAAPEYEALSYVWGDPKDTWQITVDGSEFQATVKLVQALWYIRSDETPRTLWVDAVCINQADDVEKSQQVRMMRNIYYRATSVVAWLGLPAEDTGWLFRLIKRLSGDFELHLPSARRDLGCESQSDLSDPSKFLIRLIHEFARGWFWRVWTVQEAVTA